MSDVFTHTQAVAIDPSVSLPPTSLIICSRNRPSLLAQAVRSILQGDEIPTELIIIDQSEDRHTELPNLQSGRNCSIRYLWEQSVGISRARNAGIAAARHDILAMTDDDIIATPAWFGTLVRALVAAGRYSVVTGQVLPDEGAEPDRFAPSTKSDPIPTVYAGRVGTDVLYTNNMALYHSIIDGVGNFDECLGPGTDFPAAEDNDLGFRLLEAGYRIAYVPAAVLYHCAWRSERNYLPLRWRYGRGQGAYYAKYFSVKDRYMLRRLLKDIRHYGLRSVRRARDQRRLAYGDAVYVLGLLVGAIHWRLARHRTR